MAARALLGIGPAASLDELRRAYRTRLRAAHPDLRGLDAGTADVVAAYRLLRDAPVQPEEAAAPEHVSTAVVVDGDTVTADLPAGDLFALLVEAGHGLGEVAYVDAQAGLLEVIVEVAGYGACSVVLTLQGRTVDQTAPGRGPNPCTAPGGGPNLCTAPGGGPNPCTEAWCTVEPLGGGPAPPTEVVTALLADGLRAVTGR